MSKYTILISLILISIVGIGVPASAVLNVTSVSKTPGGVLSSGTPVTLSYKILFSASGGETFPSGDELVMETDLDDAKWQWSLILDGVENPRPMASGKTLSLPGFELSYPSSVKQSMKVTLQGTIPSSKKPLVIKIYEIDSQNHSGAPVYILYNGNSGIVTRRFTSPVSPGSECTIRLVPSINLQTSPGWQVSESIPYGFTFIRSTAFYTVQTGPDSYTFIQNSSTPIVYYVKAPVTESPYSFSGTFTDADMIRGQVTGNSAINVGTAFLKYRNVSSGKIERMGAIRSVLDNKKGKISNKVTGSVLFNYFMGL